MRMLIIATFFPFTLLLTVHAIREASTASLVRWRLSRAGLMVMTHGFLLMMRCLLPHAAVVLVVCPIRNPATQASAFDPV